jgi:GxxExxY protein
MGDVDDITRTIIGCAIAVHRVAGPGLLESVYELAMCIELAARGVPYLRQVSCPLVYRGVRVGDYRLDVMVADQVAVEIKSAESIRPVHVAQMLTYLRASGKQVGLIINFNVAQLTHGVRRVILGELHG